MSRDFVIDALTRDAQRRAADPAASAWVSANAGSGKTHVLAQRVKRLLLAGVKPEKILCLTFTKAAAGNMANRILNDLAAWVGMDDATLRQNISSLGGAESAQIGEKQLQRARRVFALALETPGGLKIQTIHAFCDALLHQFPFEAGLAGNFQVLDELAHNALVAEAFEKVLAESKTSEALSAAFARLALTMTPGELQKTVAGYLKEVASGLPASEDLQMRLFSALGFDRVCSEESLREKILAEAQLPPALWPRAIAALEEAQATDRERAQDFRTALQAHEAERAEAYFAIYRTRDGKMRKSGSKFVTAKLAPDVAALMNAELQRLARLETLLALARIAEDSFALMSAARAVHAEIEKTKAARGLLDYGDLIRRAAMLLGGEGAAWVRYKLDRGIDHVLVDESQDTSEAQWRIISGLTQEFFAGQGAHDALRTLFAVGDDKQSIFSFQGAAPALFDAERRRVMAASRDAQLCFEDVKLNLSFRSSPVIMKAVDAIFARREAASGVGSDVFPPHLAARAHLPGCVDIWPLETPGGAADMEGWNHPFDAVARDDPRVRLAERIASEIAAALRTSSVLGENGARPLTPGDILILVRTRSLLFDAIIRDLKKAGIPVAGADRLILTEHIAAMDLMALGDAVLLPEDDLTFAALLKSPLLGLGEADLFELAHARKAPLYMELACRAGENSRWRLAQDRFSAWRDYARSCRPYEFYAHVLGAGGARQAFYERLGYEAGDILDEFLRAALQFETVEIPALQNFLHWLRATRAEIKREFQQSLDEVRVMTVHNAKGLEAKWVILADTADAPGTRQLGEFYKIGNNDVVLWAQGQKNAIGPLADAKSRTAAAQEAEYRRLLYVALTRAEERLTIAGAQGQKEIAPDCWYALAHDALRPLCEEERDGSGKITRWTMKAGVYPEFAHDLASVEASDIHAAAWLRSAAPVAAPPPYYIAPSRFSDESRPVSAPSQTARRRGALLHSLLQHLPALGPEKRRDAAKRFLNSCASDLSSQEAGALIEEALNVLRMPEADSIFGIEALAEVPISSNITFADGNTAVLSGQIDRLLISQNGIMLVDFKSGVAPPPGEIPDAYVSQLTLYREALKPIAGSRAIQCCILWTAVPRLDEIAERSLDAMLANVA